MATHTVAKWLELHAPISQGFLALAKDGDEDRAEQALKQIVANVESVEARNAHVHVQMVSVAHT